jgi:hypothetical protein
MQGEWQLLFAILAHNIAGHPLLCDFLALDLGQIIILLIAERRFRRILARQAWANWETSSSALVR